MLLLKKIKIKWNQFQIMNDWKSMNKHNSTWLGRSGHPQYFEFVRSGGIRVGNYTYGKINVNYTGNKSEKLIIGNYCSISATCLFILGGEHDYQCISTFPFISRIGTYPTEVLSKGAIVLEDEVWIGDNVTVLSGVHIGKGAVVAAGSVVTRNVYPYAVVAGNPARIIKYRFSPNIIERLVRIHLDIDTVDDNLKELLTRRINEDNIHEIIKALFDNGSIADGSTAD